MKRVVHVDGACLGNPGPGGYCALLAGAVLAKGGVEDTTNNRMEITAALEALAALPVDDADVVVVSDSRYLVDGATTWVKAWVANGWRTKAKKGVLNRDLWEALLLAVERHDGRVTFRWVKGHDGDAANERADEIASEEALRVADVPAWSRP